MNYSTYFEFEDSDFDHKLEKKVFLLILLSLPSRLELGLCFWLFVIFSFSLLSFRRMNSSSGRISDILRCSVALDPPWKWPPLQYWTTPLTILNSIFGGIAISTIRTVYFACFYGFLLCWRLPRNLKIFIVVIRFSIFSYAYSII